MIHDLMHNPHAPLVPLAMSITSGLVNLQPVLTAVLTAVSIAWYGYLFYREWKSRGKH